MLVREMEPITLRGSTQAASPVLTAPVRGTGSFSISRQRYRGIPDSVGYMVQLAREGQTDPTVRRFAEKVVRKVTPKDHLSELAALYYEVARTVRYTRDPAQAEFLQHPAIVLRHRAGDCDDQSIILRASIGAVRGRFGAMAQSIGQNVEYVTAGFTRGQPNKHTHVFVRAYIPRLRRWVIMDPVAGPASRQMVRRVVGFRSYPT